MKILITGASGLVGSALVPALKSDGHEIISLVRSAPKRESEVQWEPEREVKGAAKLEGIGAAVHLAGENLGDGRWTEEKKRRIRDSRVVGTRVLCNALLKLDRPPQTLISSSAIGFYGNRGSETLIEESSVGDDFLAKICDEWERATDPLKEKGVRVTHARFGIILSNKGGALAKMLTPFKLGIGGKLGDGKQYMSWIAIDDIVSAVRYILKNENLSGPLNLTAPNPVTNKEFTEALGKTLSRPTFLGVPEFALKIMFGEMAENTILSSARVLPKRLQDAGYKFLFPTLETALKHLLK